MNILKDQKKPDSTSLVQKYANLVVLRTFSKAYGLANLRVGYSIASEEITTILNITRGPFNTTSISQLSALMALEDEDFLEETYKRNIENKVAFMEFCNEVGLDYYDSEANFFICQTTN